MTAKYQRMNGSVCSGATDPMRMIWYSSCTFWTDELDILDTSRGVPLCPLCGSPGFQTTAEAWFGGIASHDKDTPGYETFMLTGPGRKNVCNGRGFSTGELWDQHV